MLIVIDNLTIVNTNDIVKVQAVRDKTHAWLILRGEDRPVRIEMKTFWFIYNLTSKRFHKSKANINADTPHTFIQDGIDTCVCGKLDTDAIHLKEV